MIRIGYGYDVHRLEEGKKLYLGGVLISDQIGTIAHSDGDVLLHSMCDALLGAAALGDIGTHFPDNDERFRGISSLELLRETCNLITQNGFGIVNIDSTIILEKPKIVTYTNQMRENIFSVLNIPIESISIKATTSEQLGFIGKGRGIAAHSVVLIQTIDT